MNEIIELVDLGDAMVETKQYSFFPVTFDSQFQPGDYN